MPPSLRVLCRKLSRVRKGAFLFLWESNLVCLEMFNMKLVYNLIVARQECEADERMSNAEVEGCQMYFHASFHHRLHCQHYIFITAYAPLWHAFWICTSIEWMHLQWQIIFTCTWTIASRRNMHSSCSVNSAIAKICCLRHLFTKN